MENLEEKKEEAKKCLEKLKIKLGGKELEEKGKQNTENDVIYVFFLYCL